MSPIADSCRLGSGRAGKVRDFGLRQRLIPDVGHGPADGDAAIPPIDPYLC
jgi:hypothetical protein